MATYTWNSATTADWTTAARWTPAGGPPGKNAPLSTDVANIPTISTTKYTVSVASGETFDIDTLNYSNTQSTSGAPTLSITGTLKLNTLALSSDTGTKTHIVNTTINSGGVLQLGTAITVTGNAETITDNGTVIGKGSVASGVTLAGTGIVKASGGTLDLLGTFSSGPTLAIDTTAGSDLKIDGTATSKAITINNANQTLEVGATGALTISAAQNVTGGTIKLDGGNLTDSNGVSFGTTTSEIGTLSGFGTVTGALTRSGTGTADTVTASGGTLTLAAAVGANSGLVFDIANSATSVLSLSAVPGTGNTSRSLARRATSRWAVRRRSTTGSPVSMSGPI